MLTKIVTDYLTGDVYLYNGGELTRLASNEEAKKFKKEIDDVLANFMTQSNSKIVSREEILAAEKKISEKLTKTWEDYLLEAREEMALENKAPVVKSSNESLFSQIETTTRLYSCGVITGNEYTKAINQIREKFGYGPINENNQPINSNPGIFYQEPVLDKMDVPEPKMLCETHIVKSDPDRREIILYTSIANAGKLHTYGTIKDLTKDFEWILYVDPRYDFDTVLKYAQTNLEPMPSNIHKYLILSSDGSRRKIMLHSSKGNAKGLLKYGTTGRNYLDDSIYYVIVKSTLDFEEVLEEITKA